MELKKCKKLSIISEGGIEKQIINDLKEHGARGFTAWEVWGDGSRGSRGDEWDEDKNIKIEVICSTSLANELFEVLHEKYSKLYGMIIFVEDVEVKRAEKFDKLKK